MQNIKNNQQKKKKSHTSVKYILSSISLISTVAFWQHFSNNDVVKSADAGKTNLEPVDQLLQFQPLPTLMSVQIGSGSGGIQSGQNNDAITLREVTAPTMQPRSKPPITLQQVFINNGSNSSNTITRTGSSR